MTELPKKASVFLTMALHDLELLESNPYYRIDMEKFCNPDVENNICSICLTGAVMANQFDLDKNNNYLPTDDLFGVWKEPLMCLEDVRLGSFDILIDVFEPNLDNTDKKIIVTELEQFYDKHQEQLLDGLKLSNYDDPEMFKKMMKSVVSSLVC